MEPLLDMMGLRGAHLMNFGKAIKLGGTALVGYNLPYLESLNPPVCLKSLRLSGGVLVEGPVSISVCEKAKCLACVVLLVHYHHGHPLVCC